MHSHRVFFLPTSFKSLDIPRHLLRKTYTVPKTSQNENIFSGGVCIGITVASTETTSTEKESMTTAAENSMETSSAKHFSEAGQTKVEFLFLVGCCFLEDLWYPDVWCILTYMFHEFEPHVGKSTIHGTDGIESGFQRCVFFPMPCSPKKYSPKGQWSLVVT